MSESRRRLLLTLEPRNQITVLQRNVCKALRFGVCLVLRVRHYFATKLAEQIRDSGKNNTTPR
ncbi:hypothetical protein [uncultured Amphritea sp.]|mgnify:CR=1 FL=1|uniref:hypothetical protein n=1 Tax=uncultured Amphritea sp. TaxID=981605 RepID=UPI00262D65AC|nr:hypothetical protein [uncultured Amphritea sp.]